MRACIGVSEGGCMHIGECVYVVVYECYVWVSVPGYVCVYECS